MIPLDPTDEPGVDRGVSPVIGVVLMVAVTVILASVIGTYVLDLGASAGRPAPSATLDVSLDPGEDNVTVSHRGGDALDDGRTRIVLTNESTGDSLDFVAGSSDRRFAVGEDLVIDAVDGRISSRDSDVWAGIAGSGSTFPIVRGSQYTVQIIDTASRRVIFETTSTA